MFLWGSDVSSVAGKTCVCLLELQASILQDLAKSDFENIKKLILASASVFWVTAFDDPSLSMIDHLARVVRNETLSLSRRTFHANRVFLSSSDRLAELISTAFNSESEEDEYLVKDDLLQMSCIKEDVVLKEQINDLLPGAISTVTSVPLKDAEFVLKMCIQTPGMLDSICMKMDKLAGTELKLNNVEIQVKAFSAK